MDTRVSVEVPSNIIRKWQDIVDVAAEILRVPAALIMKVEPPNIRVFVSSESAGNPYEKDELACLNTGLYCETVMQTRRILLVPDALVDQDWNANPDIKLGMISYMGLPVTWPNGDIFGTICVLDSTRNEYSELYRKLLFQCREMLQADLALLQANNELELSVFNRTAELHKTRTELAYVARTATLGELSATIAHEVKQPLAGIAARAGAALRWLSGERPNVVKAQESLRQIGDAARMAADVVTNVRAMFKKDEPTKSTIDFNNLIRSVLALVYIDLREQCIECKIDLGEQVPPIVGIEVQLQQVILNLIINAIESMSGVEPRVLTIESKFDANTLWISIADTGCGIEPSNIQRIFDPLFTTKQRGMGMGLSICRSIIESHNGQIWASAGALRGSIFQINLPTR